MSYQVLALKWRPQIFEDVVGQEPVTLTLKNAIQQGRIAHAFLFSGVRGVGKTTTARILAKALNCESGPTVRPCGQCAACREIASGRSLDVLEVDGASHTKVEEFRVLLETMPYAPSRDRYKIYIVDEVHMLSTHSFNALLKTLEEPPPHVKFIFATTEYHKIPETILSRCQQFEFRTVSSNKIAAQLRKIADQENIRLSDGALGQIVRAAEGSLRDALSALDQVISAVGSEVGESDVTELLGLIDRDVLRDTAAAIVERDTAAILKTVDALVQNGRDLRSFARGLMQYFRDVLVARVAPEEPELVELGSEREELAALAGRLSQEDLVRVLDVLSQAEASLRWSPEPRYHLEVALLKLSQLAHLASFEELLARFEAIAGGERSLRSVVGPSSEGNSGGSGPERAVPKKNAGPGERSRPVRTKVLETGEPATGPPSETTASSEPPESGNVLLERVLDRMRVSKPMLHALLARHVRVRLENECLRVWFSEEQRMFQSSLDETTSRETVAALASEIAGRPLRVEFALLEREVEEPPAEGGDDSEGRALRERALKDPLVRRFMETFQGEVEEVRNLGDPES